MRMFFWICLAIVAFSTPIVAQEAGRLTVVGHGSHESAPDMATINMGVTSESRTAADALAINSADTAKMLAVIQAAGVADKDVQTSGLSLSPLWSNRNSSSDNRAKIVGYTANNQVTVRVRDLDQLGVILDAVVSSGANRFNGLNFGLQDAVPATDSARVAAVKDAARKAQLYASAAGITLGPILDLSETGTASPGNPMMLREMAMSDAVPIAGGEVSVTASVTIVYEIAR